MTTVVVVWVMGVWATRAFWAGHSSITHVSAYQRMDAIWGGLGSASSSWRGSPSFRIDDKLKYWCPACHPSLVSMKTDPTSRSAACMGGTWPVADAKTGVNQCGEAVSWCQPLHRLALRCPAISLDDPQPASYGIKARSSRGNRRNGRRWALRPDCGPEHPHPSRNRGSWAHSKRRDGPR